MGLGMRHIGNTPLHCCENGLRNTEKGKRVQDGAWIILQGNWKSYAILNKEIASKYENFEIFCKQIYLRIDQHGNFPSWSYIFALFMPKSFLNFRNNFESNHMWCQIIPTIKYKTFEGRLPSSTLADCVFLSPVNWKTSSGLLSSNPSWEPQTYFDLDSTSETSVKTFLSDSNIY